MRKVLKRLSAIFMLLLMLVTSFAVDVAPSWARTYRHRPARYRYLRSRRRISPRRRRAIRRARARRARARHHRRYYY